MKKYYVFSLMFCAFWLGVSFLVFPNFFRESHLKDFGLLIGKGLNFILPIPNGDEYWVPNLIFVFLTIYIEALIIVTVTFFLIRWGIRYFRLSRKQQPPDTKE